MTTTDLAAAAAIATAITPTRLLTVDDAVAAAEILRETYAGHEGAALDLATESRLEDLLTPELEALCAAFGVEV